MPEVQNVMEPGETREMLFEQTRALRYAELFMVGPEWIYVYNSIGLSEAPAEQWDALVAVEIAEQLGVDKVMKNGPHWWMSDTATLEFSVDEITVGGIGFRYAARLPAFIVQSGKIEPQRYHVNVAKKAGVLTYDAGKPVYELVSPDGDAFVLQSMNIDPSEIGALGERLTPAEGWAFRTRMIDEEFRLTLDGQVKVVADDFMNFYNLPPSESESEESDEGEDKPLEVAIAIYPGPDSARADFDAVTALVEGGSVESEGLVLITRGADGKAQAEEGGAHHRGVRGFVTGRVTRSVVEAMDEKLPPGTAGVIAVYGHDHSTEVHKALSGAMTKSIGHMDKASPKGLKAGLEQAQRGLGT